MTWKVRNSEFGVRNGSRAILSSKFEVRSSKLPTIPHSAFRIPHSNGGFSSIEYAVLIAIAAAAFVGMSLYTMRAASGRWRQVGDVFGYGRQYDPKVTTGPSEVRVTNTAEIAE